MEMDGSMIAMNKILSNLQEKYKYFNNLFQLTKQMEEVIASNDQVSLAAILDMRQKNMSLVDKLDAENKAMVERLPKPMKERMQGILFPKGEPVRLENPLETNIFDTNKRNLMLLSKIISLDEKINKSIRKW